MRLDRYFAVIASVLERHWAVLEDRTDYEQFSPSTGRVQSRVTLLDGSYLDFSEFVEETAGRVKRIRYRFQYVREGDRIFRYDNFPGHPGAPPPHHHCHAPDGEVTPMSTHPTLLEVIEQAINYLFAT